VDFVPQPGVAVHALFGGELFADREDARDAVLAVLDEVAARVPAAGPYVAKWARRADLNSMDITPEGWRVEVFPCDGECDQAKYQVQDAHAQRLNDRSGGAVVTLIPAEWKGAAS
jgi:hypothetical protein